MSSVKDFEILEKLGEGSFSIVYKVKRKSDGNLYAMKKVKISMLSQKEKENALNEIRILASISNPYIIGYKEAFFDETSSTLCIVMEFAINGDVQHKISSYQKKRQNFKESEIWKIISNMASGLKTLHDMKIVHRDIKCANIFISKNDDYKLGDLNVSKISNSGLAYTQTGTPYYAAPEIWKGKAYDFKCDVWSLGCVAYEMCTFKPPFRGLDMEGLYRKIQSGVFDKIPRTYSDDLQKFLTACLKVKSELRPSPEEILNHPIVSQMLQSEESILEDPRKALLATIKLPKNFRLLQLPKAKYDIDIEERKQPSQNLSTKDLHKKDEPILKRKASEDIIQKNDSRDSRELPKIVPYTPNYKNPSSKEILDSISKTPQARKRAESANGREAENRKHLLNAANEILNEYSAELRKKYEKILPSNNKQPPSSASKNNMKPPLISNVKKQDQGKPPQPQYKSPVYRNESPRNDSYNRYNDNYSKNSRPSSNRSSSFSKNIASGQQQSNNGISRPSWWG